MPKTLNLPDNKTLFLPSPNTEVSSEEFLINSLCSAMGHDFIIFDDISSEKVRFVQFAFVGGVILDFPILDENDNGEHLSMIVHVLENLGFKRSIDIKSKEYGFVHLPNENIDIDLQANFTGHTEKLITFVKYVFEVLFRSNIADAKVTIGDFDTEEIITTMNNHPIHRTNPTLV